MEGISKCYDHSFLKTSIQIYSAHLQIVLTQLTYTTTETAKTQLSSIPTATFFLNSTIITTVLYVDNDFHNNFYKKYLHFYGNSRSKKHIARNTLPLNILINHYDCPKQCL